MIYCKNCGEITKDNIEIRDESIKKQNIRISPIYPKCKICGSEVTVSNTSNCANIVVINGTCGSGKTTIAELLADKNWLAIDGDCAIQSIRRRKGTKQYEWIELVNEILYEIDILSLFSQNIVLSHIVLPEDYRMYIEYFKSHNTKYKFILLKPEYHIAVERCQTRTCHASITSEEWIKYFYEKLVFDDGLFEFVDNSDITAQEVAELILKLPYKG